MTWVATLPLPSTWLCFALLCHSILARWPDRVSERQPFKMASGFSWHWMLQACLLAPRLPRLIHRSYRLTPNQWDAKAENFPSGPTNFSDFDAIFVGPLSRIPTLGVATVVGANRCAEKSKQRNECNGWLFVCLSACLCFIFFHNVLWCFMLFLLCVESRWLYIGARVHDFKYRLG